MKLSTLYTTAHLAATALAVPLSTPIAARWGLSFTMGAPVNSHIGQPIVMTWAGATGAVDIALMSGTAGDLKTVGSVATGLWGAEATYYPDAEGMYAFKIVDASGNENYSPLFWVGL